MTASLTKTIQSELIGITNVAAAGQSKSAEADLSTALAAFLLIDIAPESTNTPGTKIDIEGSFQASGDKAWATLYSMVSDRTTVNTGTADAAAAGQAVVSEAHLTGLANDQWAFLKNGTLANSEWVKVESIQAGVSFTVRDNLASSQAGSGWYNKAQRLWFPIDIMALKRLRVVLNNNYGGSSVAVNWRVALITCDSIG